VNLALQLRVGVRLKPINFDNSSFFATQLPLLYSMNPTALLLQLQQHTYVQLKPSGIHGIGVFAICDIPKGCRDMFAPPHNHFTHLSYAQVATLPTHVQAVIENYCLYDEAGYFVPNQGFTVMDVSLFLNHSDTPNLVSVNDGDYFEAIEDIPAGTELTLNYGTIV
jgi:SET domain-containing protein